MSKKEELENNLTAPEKLDIKARPLFDVIFQFQKSQDICEAATNAMEKVLIDVNSITRGAAATQVIRVIPKETVEEEHARLEMIQDCRRRLTNVRVGIHNALGLFRDSATLFGFSQNMANSLLAPTSKEKSAVEEKNDA